MTLNTFLQFFLLADVFLIGIAVTIAVQHATAHFRPRKYDAEHQPQAPQQIQSIHLPPAVRERLIEASKANFKLALEHSAVELQHELKSTTTQLNDHLEKLGRELFSHEMERYRMDLEQLRKRADVVIGGAQSEIAEHQAQLRTRLAEDMAAEKQQLIQQLDTKLGDAVGSFLAETLGHEADLGAQTAYLMAALEEHKAEIIKGVTEE